jgi:hypothetical protein
VVDSIRSSRNQRSSSHESLSLSSRYCTLDSRISLPRSGLTTGAWDSLLECKTRRFWLWALKGFGLEFPSQGFCPVQYWEELGWIFARDFSNSNMGRWRDESALKRMTDAPRQGVAILNSLLCNRPFHFGESTRPPRFHYRQIPSLSLLFRLTLRNFSCIVKRPRWPQGLAGSTVLTENGHRYPNYK